MWLQHLEAGLDEGRRGGTGLHSVLCSRVPSCWLLPSQARTAPAAWQRRQGDLSLSLARPPPPCRLKESKPMLQRTLAEAVVPEKVHGKVTVKREPDESAAAKVLAKELWGQCLYVNTVRR